MNEDGTRREYRVRSISALVEGDRFSFDDGLTYYVAAAARKDDSDTIDVYCDETRTVETKLDIPPDRANCLLEVVLVTIPYGCDLEIDVGAWSKKYPSVKRTPGAVYANAQRFFTPPWIPPDLFGIVNVRTDRAVSEAVPQGGSGDGISLAHLIDVEREYTYTVADWDLVSYFAERFPEDDFEATEVVASAVLMMWGERLCIQVLGFSAGFQLALTHCNFAVMGEKVKVWVKCVGWFGRMTDWEYRATSGDLTVATGRLTMSMGNKKIFDRRIRTRQELLRSTAHTAESDTPDTGSDHGRDE